MLITIKNGLTAGVAALALASTSGLAAAQSLNQTLVLAYNNSQLLEQNRALLRAADEGSAQALAALRPTLSGGAQSKYVDPTLTGDNTTNNIFLSAELTLYAGGSLKLNRKIAKENVLAAREQLRGLEQKVLLNAALAFFNLRKATEVVSLQTNNVALIKRELEAAKDRFDVGAGTKTDVALAQSKLAAARSSLAAAQGQVTQARESYRLAVGVYPTKLGSPGALPRPAASSAAATNIARTTSPAIAAAQHNVVVSELNAKVAAAAAKPSLKLQGTVSRNDNYVNSSQLTLTLNQTIYAGGKINSLYRQALARSDGDKAALLQETRSVDQTVGTAWSQLTVANASLAASTDEIKAAQLAFDGLREEAQLGARTTLDVLDAEQSLLDAKTSRATALNDRYIAAYNLMAAMGVLTAKDLKLGVVLYDPTVHYDAVKNAPLRSDRGTKLDNLLKKLGME